MLPERLRPFPGTHETRTHLKGVLIMASLPFKMAPLMIFTLKYLQNCTASHHSPKALRFNFLTIDQKILSSNNRFRKRTILNICSRRASVLFVALSSVILDFKQAQERMHSSSTQRSDCDFEKDIFLDFRSEDLYPMTFLTVSILEQLWASRIEKTS